MFLYPLFKLFAMEAVEALETRVEGLVSSSPINKKCCFKVEKDKGLVSLVYAIEMPGSTDFDTACSISRVSFSSLRDSDGRVAAGVRTNSYFWANGKKSYLVGVYVGHKFNFARFRRELTGLGFEQVNVPVGIILSIIRNLDLQRAAVLPLAQTEALPAHYPKFIAYLYSNS